MSSLIKRIDEQNKPQFPCWLYAPSIVDDPNDCGIWTFRNSASDAIYTLTLATHWHPDQPEAPKEVPEQIVSSKPGIQSAYNELVQEHASPAPSTSEGKGADTTSLLTSAERLHEAIAVFLKDWKDGDFELPRLAQIHVENIREKYQDVGKALNFGEESYQKFMAAMPSADDSPDEAIAFEKWYAAYENPFSIQDACAAWKAGIAYVRARSRSTSPEQEREDVAKGHNPDGITNERVGLGYRLLDLAEIEARIYGDIDDGVETDIAQKWISHCYYTLSPSHAYRTRLSREELALQRAARSSQQHNKEGA